MRIERMWAMANKNTFSIAPIEKMIHEEIDTIISAGGVLVDPFSNGVRFSQNSIINDLNPNVKADTHMDALDFLKTFENESVDVVLYDPPYSLRQVTECYKGYGVEVTQETTQSTWRSKHLDEIERILKVGGKAICFGWNSNGVGKKRGFELSRVLVVPHGGSKNDTICTVEIKRYAQEKLPNIRRLTMAKKRNCRRTETEDKLHDKAVKMRKMTDEQLVNYVNDRVEKAKSEGFNQGKRSGGGKSIGDFVKEISELRGIGQATVSKIKAYAEEMGYMKETV